MDRKWTAIATLVLLILVGTGFALWRAEPAPAATTGATSNQGPSPASPLATEERAQAPTAEPAPVQRDAIAAPEPRVFGQVVNQEGVSLRDAVVTLFDYTTSTKATAQTGQDGQYD